MNNEQDHLFSDQQPTPELNIEARVRLMGNTARIGYIDTSSEAALGEGHKNSSTRVVTVETPPDPRSSIVVGNPEDPQGIEDNEAWHAQERLKDIRLGSPRSGKKPTSRQQNETYRRHQEDHQARVTKQVIDPYN